MFVAELVKSPDLRDRRRDRRRNGTRRKPSRLPLAGTAVAALKSTVANLLPEQGTSHDARRRKPQFFEGGTGSAPGVR